MHCQYEIVMLTDVRTDGQKGLRNTVRCITCIRTVKMSIDNPYYAMQSFDRP